MSLKGTVWTPIGPSPITEGSTRDMAWIGGNSKELLCEAA